MAVEPVPAEFEDSGRVGHPIHEGEYTEALQVFSERFSRTQGLGRRPPRTIRLDHHGNAHERSRGTMETCSAGSVGVEGTIQAFLEPLAAGGGQPTEQMNPTETRAALVGTQSSVAISLPKVDGTLRTLTRADQTVKLSC